MSRRASDDTALAPSADDALVRAASEVVGGPLGRHAAPRALRGSPAGPLLVLGGTAVLALGALTRSHCRATDWASPDQFTHACYSDVASRVASGTIAEQPPGAALLTRALAGVTSSPRAAFDVSVLLAGAALAVAVLALVLLARPGRTGSAVTDRAPTARRPWSAAALALSPVLLVSGLVSLELVAVAGVALGLLAWARGRPAASGAALALAATVDPLAAAVLVATWAVAVAARRGPLVVASGLAALLSLGAVALLWQLTGLAGQALALRTAEGALGAARAVAAAWVPGWGGQPGYGSAWLLPSLPAGSTVDVPGWLVVTGAALSTAATAALVVVLARRWAASTSPGAVLAQAPALALVAVVGVLVAAPTVPVQSSLLLLPLVAASGLLWRDHLPWAVVDAAAATATWLYIYGQQVPNRGAEPWVYALLLCLRLLTAVWLAVAVVRRHTAPAGPGERPAGLWTTVGGLRSRR